MSTGTVERVYQLTKVSSGDWLLPSNDGNTVWRICQYLEEVNGKHYWGFAKYDRPLVESSGKTLTSSTGVTSGCGGVPVTRRVRKPSRQR